MASVFTRFFVALLATFLVTRVGHPLWAVLLWIFAAPFWTPDVLVSLRNRVFTRINGDDGMLFPNNTVFGKNLEWLYNHPALSIRSRQSSVGLSDVFWYLLAPVHYVHQEHAEADTPTYVAAQHVTAAVLNARDKPALDAMAVDECERMLATFPAGQTDFAGWATVRLRDCWFPVFTRLFYALIFDEPAPAEDEALLCASGQDIIHALKGCKLRNMALRERAAARLEALVAGGKAARFFAGTPQATLSLREKALHLLGVFFHTGSVQLSEGMAHVCMCLATHPRVQARLCALEGDPEAHARLLDGVLTEQMRLFPLFGVAHRIAAEAVTLPDSTVVPAGAVVLFNFLQHHLTGYDRATEFVPERWDALVRREVNYMPFGVPRNRPCPAQRLSQVWMRTLLATTLRQVTLRSWVAHTRSMPDRGPCLLVWRSTPRAGPSAVLQLLLLTGLWLREHAEAVPRALTQLVATSLMLLDARRQRLAYRFYSEGVAGADLDQHENYAAQAVAAVGDLQQPCKRK